MDNTYASRVLGRNRRLHHFSLAFVGVLLASGLALVGSATPARADTAVAVPFLVNFQAQTTATPAGYVGDYGQAYDATRGYGWVDDTGAPLSLVGNGRERG